MQDAHAVQVAECSEQLPCEHLDSDHWDVAMGYRSSGLIEQSTATLDHLAERLMVQWSHYVQVSVRRLITLAVIVINYTYDVGVVTRALEQLKLTILVPCILIYALYRDDFPSEEIRASINHSE